MGGDVSRTMLLQSNFLTNSTFPTFGAGPINKLITIATPHLGTPVAADLLASNNACVRNVLASDQNYALASITFSGQTANGAVGDLEGNGFGSSLSPALTNLKSTQPFKTAYIAGNATFRKPEWPELHFLYRGGGEGLVFQQSAGKGSDGYEVDHDLWPEQ